MALTDILDQIKKEADAEVDKLNAERDEQIYAIQKEFAKTRETRSEEMEKRIEGNVAKVKSRAETFAKMQTRNNLLTAKRKLLREILDNSTKALISGNDVEKILVALLKKAAGEFKEGEIVPAKGMESEVKKALSASGAPFELSSKTADIQGGFILLSGKVEVDFSFGSILEKELWNELEMKLNQMLF